MAMPGFTAENTLTSSSRPYRRVSSVAVEYARVLPQATWSNCSADGRLCYTCSDDAGICIYNWFYDGVWFNTTDCGTG